MGGKFPFEGIDLGQSLPLEVLGELWIGNQPIDGIG